MHTNTHTSPCQVVPLNLVNEDLTLSEDLRQLLLELPVLLVIGQRLNRSGAQRRDSRRGEETEGETGGQTGGQTGRRMEAKCGREDIRKMKS